MTTSFKVAVGLMLSLVAVFSPFNSLAQEDIFGIERKMGRKSESEVGNIFRNTISKISFELSTGAGYHQNKLDFSSQAPETYPITNSFDPEMPIEIGEDTPAAFKGDEYAFPVHAGVRVDLFGIFTIGGGYGREWGRIGGLGLEDYQFDFEESAYVLDKYYGTLGLVLYDARRRVAFLKWRYRKYSGNNHYMQSELKQRVRQNYPWHFILEGEYGSMRIKKSFDSHLSVSEPFYALGFRIEREFSEYAKIFVKPAANFATFSYDQSVVVDNLEVFEKQNISQNLYTVNVGISISLPGTKRCKVGGCGVVMKHLHNGVEYRGSSIWQLQNRKVGQW